MRPRSVPPFGTAPNPLEGPIGGPIWGYGIGGGYGTGAYGGGNAPNVELMMQAVVTLGESVTEGGVIEAVAIPWFAIVDAIRRDPALMHQIDWRKWEEMIAGAYKAAGYDIVTLTPRSGDKGRDIIATREDLGSIRIIEQVKAYAPGNLVPANDVRALMGVLSMDRNVSKGILTTTSDFAPGVYADQDIRSFMPNRLDLRPGPKLLQWLSQIRNKGCS